MPGVTVLAVFVLDVNVGGQPSGLQHGIRRGKRGENAELE